MQGPKRQLTTSALRNMMMYVPIRDLYVNPKPRGLNHACGLRNKIEK